MTNRIYFMLVVLFFSCNTEIERIDETFDDGSPKIVITYSDDSESAEKVYYKEYYDNHLLKFEGAFKNDKRHGKWKSFHANGNPWSTVIYNLGIREGETLMYHEDGKLYIRGQFKNEEAHELWTWYNKEGEVVKEIDYSNSKKGSNNP